MDSAAPTPAGGGSPDDVVDISGWAVIRDEPGGRDPDKRWVARDAESPRHEQWLWKSRQCTGDCSSEALTDCAEVTVSRLAAVLCIPAAECRYAVCDGKLGLISRNVAPQGYDLSTARTYLPEVDGYAYAAASSDDEAVGRMRRDTGYTLEAVEAVLDGVLPPPGLDWLPAFGVFAGYLVLDALVGNSDRHPGNWALLESTVGERLLAPTYDHGSALGAGLTEQNRQRKDPEAFARRGRANPFAPPRQGLVEVAAEAVRRTRADVWIARVRELDGDAVRATLAAPDGRMSEVATTFMTRVVLENRRRLCDDDAGKD